MNYAIDHADLIQEDAIDDDGAIQDLSKITYLDLTLGNICNLQCKTCNPWSSHNWLKEVKELPHQDFDELQRQPSCPVYGRDGSHHT